MASRIYELSQCIENGMTFFPGDPEPRIEPAAAAATPWRVSQLHLGTHTGTHIDAASHFYPDGKTIDQYTLDRFILPGVVAPALNLAEDQPIRPQLLAEALARLPKGGALAIRTDWDRFWKTDRYRRHPHLSPEAAQALVAEGVGLIAIDALNPDSTVQETSHVHEILLGNDILIVENLTGLAQLQAGRIYQFSFMPLLLRALDGSPVRAVAWEI
jgi:kynurenine formamidase